MSEDHALESTHGQETLMIYGADLYLLEKWNEDTNVSDDVQRSEIFSQWLDIGCPGRLPYLRRLRRMVQNREDISDGAKDFLARVRHPSDRQAVNSVRLVRTFYGDGSDARFAQLISESEFDDPIFENAALYDGGSDNGLQLLRGILTRIPQIIEVSEGFADIYYQEQRNSLQDDIEAGPEGPNWEYAVEMTHQAARWSHVLIYDKEADEIGDVLLIYIDDRGRVLRYCRAGTNSGTDDLWAAKALLWTGQDVMHTWWAVGRYGGHWESPYITERWNEAEDRSGELEHVNGTGIPFLPFSELLNAL